MRNVIHINLIVTMFISKLAFVTVHYLQDIPVSIITQQELRKQIRIKVDYMHQIYKQRL